MKDVPEQEPMRMLLLCLLVSTLSSAAKEITVREAAWDDLSHALNVTPFYIEVESAVASRSVHLVLEVYRGGELIKTHQSTGISTEEPKAINIKSALFFQLDPAGDAYSVTWTLNSDGSIGSLQFPLLKSIADLQSGRGAAASSRPIAELQKSLLYTVICNAKAGHSMGDSLESTILGNPTATVLAIHLVRD